MISLQIFQYLTSNISKTENHMCVSPNFEFCVEVGTHTGRESAWYSYCRVLSDNDRWNNFWFSRSPFPFWVCNAVIQTINIEVKYYYDLQLASP
jgi:hypothetical protein